ncbi:MAG: RNA polymerase factor sigma-32, partial [Pararheinheimera sp.]|nr:RNA polymerase factor sigma-32 [Rheinheimera sp.]
MTQASQMMNLTVAGSGSLEAYTHAVSTIPMLTAEEERSLAEK